MRFAPLGRLGMQLAELGLKALKRVPGSGKLAAMAVACSALSVANGAPDSSPAPARELQVADYRSYLPETHSVRRALHAFAQAVQHSSSGQLRIQVLPGTVQGTPAEQILAVRQGGQNVPHLMLLAATGLADLHQDFALFDLPYAVPDEAQADAIMDGEQGRALFSRLPSLGLVGLGWMENGFRHISTRSTELRAAADLNGLAVRTLPTPISTATFEAWGAKPVSIPASRVHEALLSGTVEAQEGFVTPLLQGRLHEVQKHLWLTGHSYGAQALVINADAWRTLTPAEQGWLQDAALAASRQQRAWARDEARQTLDSLASLGMTVHEVSPGMKQDLANATLDMRRESNRKPNFTRP